jgi:hypothetical protein
MPALSPVLRLPAVRVCLAALLLAIPPLSAGGCSGGEESRPFRSDSGGFLALFPAAWGPVQVGSASWKRGSETALWQTASVMSAEGTALVGVCDPPKSAPLPDLDRAVRETVAARGGVLLSEPKVAAGPPTSAEATFTAGTQATPLVGRVRVFVEGGRLFQLVAVVPREADLARPSVRAFFDSFRYAGPGANAASGTAPPVSPSAVPSPAPTGPNP